MYIIHFLVSNSSADRSATVGLALLPTAIPLVCEQKVLLNSKCLSDLIKS